MSKIKRSNRGKRAVPRPCPIVQKRTYLNRHDATIAARLATGRHGKKFYPYLCNKGDQSCGKYHLTSTRYR